MINNELNRFLPLILLIFVFNVSCEKENKSVDEILTPSLTVTDIDSNTYNTITIGNQIWMAENLKVTRYRNGDIIGTTYSDYSNESNPKYQWAYDNNENNVDTYGRLYTWYATVDNRCLCPNGWHVPSDAEWNELSAFLGGDSIAGGKLKEAGLSHWANPNGGATNETHFNALPGGYKSSGDYTFASIGKVGFWQSSSQEDSINGAVNDTLSIRRQISYITASLIRTTWLKNMGFSIRCIKD